VAGFCEHGNERSGSLRKQDFFDKLTFSFSNNVLHHGVSVIINLEFFLVSITLQNFKLKQAPKIIPIILCFPARIRQNTGVKRTLTFPGSFVKISSTDKSHNPVSGSPDFTDINKKKLPTPTAKPNRHLDTVNLTHASEPPYMNF
jgi:hypothetical protein